MKEQATLCAEEITADSVHDFIADPEKERKAQPSDILTVSKPISEKIESSSPPTTAEHFHLQNGGPSVPKVNGKHNKHVELSKLKEKEKLLSWDHDLAKMIFANTARPREVLPGLESWQTSKIVAWHSLEGNSIQWLCVVSIDQRGKFTFYSAISIGYYGNCGLVFLLL